MSKHIPLPNLVPSELNPVDPMTMMTYSEKRYWEAIKQQKESEEMEESKRLAEEQAKNKAAFFDVVFGSAIELMKSHLMNGELAVEMVLGAHNAAHEAVYGESLPLAAKPVKEETNV